MVVVVVVAYLSHLIETNRATYYVYRLFIWFDRRFSLLLFLTIFVFTFAIVARWAESIREHCLFHRPLWLVIIHHWLNSARELARRIPLTFGWWCTQLPQYNNNNQRTRRQVHFSIYISFCRLFNARIALRAFVRQIQNTLNCNLPFHLRPVSLSICVHL